MASSKIQKSLASNVNNLEDSVNSFSFKTAQINGGSSASFTFNNCAVLFVFRNANATGVLYSIDTWNGVRAITSSDSDITVTSSNHAVTVKNSKSSAVQFVALIS